MQDQEILEGLRAEDEACFRALMDKYTRYVAAVIRKVAGERLRRQDTEELAADVFIQLWRSAHRAELSRGSLKAYLAAIARNRTLNALRAEGRAKFEELAEECVSVNSSEDEAVRREESRALNQTIRELPEPDREIFLRRYVYLERVTDIARRIGLSDKAVSARLSRMRLKLQASLTEAGVGCDQWKVQWY